MCPGLECGFDWDEHVLDSMCFEQKDQTAKVGLNHGQENT